MKFRSCFVSNSSSSSFVVNNLSPAEAKERVVACCTEFTLRKYPPKMRTPERKAEIRRKVRKFIENPEYVQFIEFPPNLGERQKAVRMKILENLTYGDIEDIEKMLQTRVRKSALTATVVADAENAFLAQFGYAPAEYPSNDPEWPFKEESVMEALERALGTYPERMT